MHHFANLTTPLGNSTARFKACVSCQDARSGSLLISVVAPEERYLYNVYPGPSIMLRDAHMILARKAFA